MSPDRQVLALILALFPSAVLESQPTAASPAVPAETASGVPSDSLRKEITDLLKSDAKAIAAAGKGNGTNLATNEPGVLTLSPYIVREPKDPVVGFPVYETRLQHFLRTGAILTIKGGKTTSTLFVGINNVDTPLIGNSAPHVKVSVGWHISF